MKPLLIACALLFSSTSYAQVNLDEPLSVDIGDRFFRSSADPKVVYTIPIGLYRTSRYFTKKQGDRLKTEFMLGLFPDQIKVGQKKVNQVEEGSKLKVFRPVEAQYIGESMDIPHEFDPKLFGANGFENLMGPTHVYLDTKKSARVEWYHIFPLSAKSLIKEVFGRRFGQQIFGDHIGSIEYSFVSIAAGEKRITKTRVGVYTSESHLDIYGELPPSRLNDMQISSAISDHKLLPEPSRDPIPLKITDHHKTPCWEESIEIGEFCLGKTL